ncbi:hypothetical protein [Streptomyces solincola]|uniref:hypothetical protein n=1 Tax=Streptomyces solincola TaxID=2100817 RepID=UPI0011B1EF17|nr:hypothetical protein [Streptomyces solincola]
MFRHRTGLRVEERWQHAYDRLRVVNEEVPSARDLARDARALAALHEWTSAVDGGHAMSS